MKCLEAGKVAVLTEKGVGFMACAGKERAHALTFNLSVSSGRSSIIFYMLSMGNLGSIT